MKRSLDAVAVLSLTAGFGWLYRSALGQPLRNADDWFHVDVAAGMLAGEAGAWARVLTGYGPSDTLRPMPWLLWAFDHARSGLDGSGYFATNLALHLLLIVAVYGLARALGAGLAGAVVAAIAVGSNLGTGQGLTFLAARDDQLAAVAVVTLMAVWTRPGLGRVGPGLLYAFACLCKPPAAIAVLLLVAHDRARIGALAAFRRAAPLFAILGLYAVTLGALIGGQLATEAPAPWHRAPLQGLLTLVTPGLGLGDGRASIGLEVAPLLLVAGGLLLRRPSSAWRAGLRWLLLTLPVPLLWLVGRPEAFNDWGRQLLLPSVGLALLAGAAVPRGRRGGVVAAAITASLLLRVAPFAPSWFAPGPSLVAALVDERAPRVAVAVPEPAVLSFLASGASTRAGLEHVRIELQGAEGAFEPAREPFGYGTLRPIPEASVPTGRVVAAWDLVAWPGGWSPWPADPGSGWSRGGFPLLRTGELPEAELRATLATSSPAAVRSPVLNLAPGRVCSLHLAFDVEAVSPLAPADPGLVSGGRFALLTWARTADGSDLWQDVALVVLDDRGRGQVRLDRVLAWSGAAPIHHLAVAGPNGRGEAFLHGVELRGCATEARSSTAPPTR